MKYTYLLASLLLLGSCGSEKTTTEKLLGTWGFEDKTLNITQEITYKEDGTYQMKMGGMDISGTWKLNEEVLITKSRPDSDGQKKTITKLDSDSLCTFWEPKGGTGRQMNYSRKK